MSKAEVERIWLPFLPWIVLATAALPGTGERHPRPAERPGGARHRRRRDRVEPLVTVRPLLGVLAVLLAGCGSDYGRPQPQLDPPHATEPAPRAEAQGRRRPARS